MVLSFVNIIFIGKHVFELFMDALNEWIHSLPPVQDLKQIF